MSRARRGSRRLAGLALVCVVFVCAGAGTNARGANAPDWLMQASKVDAGTLGAGSSAVVLGQWTEFSVDASGKFVDTERRAIRVLNLRGAQRYLRAFGEESTDYKVVSIQGWSISPSGRVMQSGKNDIATQSAYASFELFSDARVKSVSIPGAEEGAVIGYEIVREGRLPIHGEQFEMEEEIPVKLSELHVSVPAGSLRWFVNHPDRVEVVNQSGTAATFRATDRSAIPDEEEAPPWESVAAIVTVNYDPAGPAAIQSWEDAGKTSASLIADAEKSDAAILSEVDTLTAGRAEQMAKLDAVYSYVSREVRYVAVEIGVGGYQPHPAPDVFRYKYGDCKDKATLLLTMMDHIGLRGHAALVGTRGDIEADPKIPTLGTFDHMIVALPVPAELRGAAAKFASYDPQSQILWIDPTSETDPLGQLPEMDQGVYSLVVYPDKGELLRIPESTPEHNGVDYTVRAKLAADGTGTATVEADFHGSSDARRHLLYRNRSGDDIRRIFETRVANYITQASFQKVTVTGIQDNRQPIVETFSFSGNFATAMTGDSWFLQPLFLAGTDVPEVGPRPRRLALDLGPPFHLTSVYRLEMPAGMRVERTPEKASAKSDYGEVVTEYSMEGNVLVVKHTVLFTERIIPPEKYGEFRDFVNSVSRAERVRLRVVPAGQ